MCSETCLKNCFDQKPRKKYFQIANSKLRFQLFLDYKMCASITGAEKFYQVCLNENHFKGAS